jgi:hypothetical protein
VRPFEGNATASETLGWLLFKAASLVSFCANWPCTWRARGRHCTLLEHRSHSCARLSRSFLLNTKIRMRNL